MFLLFWQQKLGTKFAMMCFMLRSCIKVLDTVVFGIPESASTSHTLSCRSLLIAACTCSTFSGVLLVVGFPECGSLSIDSRSSRKHLCHTFICAALVASSPKAFWFTWIVSTEECSSLMQNLMQIHWSTRSVILNAVATQYTCSLTGIYRPHWLVQWSRHCLCMCIPVHSPWLPGYMGVTQTIFIILTMAGLYPDKPHIHPLSPASVKCSDFHRNFFFNW